VKNRKKKWHEKKAAKMYDLNFYKVNIIQTENKKEKKNTPLPEKKNNNNNNTSRRIFFFNEKFTL